MTRKQRRKTAKKGFNKKLLYSVVSVTLILLASLITYYLFYYNPTENWTAAIIDQLTVQDSLASPTFNATCISMLNTSGFDVKYYPGNAVTVEFYKNLPSKGSKIIVLRAHSSVRNNSDFVDLFTSEPYSEHMETQYSVYGDQMSIAKFFYTGDRYFAIGPTFVDRSMKGKFDDDCVVILMGCESLRETTMAEALVKKGVKAVFGWTRSIDLVETDKVTQVLLDYLLKKKYTIGGAVDKINNDFYDILGQPPSSGALLAYYPSTTKDLIIDTKDSSSASLILIQVSINSIPPFILIIMPRQREMSRRELSR